MAWVKVNEGHLVVEGKVKKLAVEVVDSEKASSGGRELKWGVK